MNQTRVITDHELAVLHYSHVTNQNSLHATVALDPGQIFSSFRKGALHEKPTRFTIQVGETEHIELQPVFLQFINHSCKPNLFFDIVLMQLTCLEKINPGDELSYFYPSTEWKMQEPFYCHCNKGSCLGKITGAAFLPQHLISHYKFTPFILNKIRTTQQ